MGKADVEEWMVASTVAPEVEDPEDPEKNQWDKNRILADWSEGVSILRTNLSSSSTKTRGEFLEGIVIPLAKDENLTAAQTLEIFGIFTQVYPRYTDARSRGAVEEVITQIVLRDQPQGGAITEKMLGWLASEAGRVSKQVLPGSGSAANLFVPFTWCCVIYTTCLKVNEGFSDTRGWNVLVGVTAILFDSILHTSGKARHGIAKATKVRLRRGLRSAAKWIPKVIDTSVTLAKSGSTPLTYLPLIGTAVDVSLRLKGKDVDLRGITPENKGSVLAFYTGSVFASKTPVSPHQAIALHDFIDSCVTEEDLTSSILPTVEKSVLRSPEVSLLVICEFFRAYPAPLSQDAFKRILTPILSCSKSSNAVVRSNATELFKVIVSKSTENREDLKNAVVEVLSLPKAGKTTGPDHRIALYTMLQSLPPSSTTSPEVVLSVLPLLTKETNDAAIGALGAALSSHLSFQLRGNEALPATVTNTIVKELANTKPQIRRAFYAAVAGAIWSLDSLETDASAALIQAILPALETSLKNVSANPVGAAAGPLEGYVAVALLLGPLKRSKKHDHAIFQNPTIQSLSIAAPKPSFLLLDKVYQKVSDPEELVWLLRAIQTTIQFLTEELSKNAHLRLQAGSLLVHVATESKSHAIRDQLYSVLRSVAQTEPGLINQLITDALVAFVCREEKPPPKPTVEEPERPIDYQKRLSSVLSASSAFPADTDLEVRKQILVNLVVLAHHKQISEFTQLLWIEICQRANVDPRELVGSKLDDLMSITFGATNSKVQPFAEAGYNAIRTLTFLWPELVIPKVMERIKLDLEGSDLKNVTSTDLGIWATPEGTTYVDVLANKKPELLDKKGKGYADAKWEAEVRQKLTAKKAQVTLSKKDQALVNEQLQKEAEIRKRVAEVRARLEHGLELVHSLASVNVEEFRAHAPQIASILRFGAFGEASEALVGGKAFDTFLRVNDASSERLEWARTWIAVAILRSLEVSGIPSHMQEEPLNGLVIRVLYRLRTVSEQNVLDAATFSLCSPLLTQVLLKGGISLTEEDDPLEQVALSLDVIKFHAGEFSNVAFPRKSIMESLIHVIRQQPRLAKDASSALVDIGQAIHSNVTPEETSALLYGTLTQEVYVRTSCLQALQPFDLTDLDWSPEILVATHDEDEQNSRLAQHLWEDNGLDIPEAFLDTLIPYLDHENAYVRASVAAALAEAVEQSPQSASRTITTLCGLYREKAKILVPEFDQFGMVIESSLNRPDPWPTRVAIGQTFKHLASSFTQPEVEPFFVFLIKEEALGDREAEVRRAMLDAGTAVIDLYGASSLPGLISMFETQLGTASTTETNDQIQEAVVILFGRLGRHLDPSDPRMPTLVERLVEALQTPAEQVQIAVSDCLAPLVNKMTSPIQQLVDRLLVDLAEAPKYAGRRGAAYGLAGVVKGVGIQGIKQYNIFLRLKAYVEDKKRYEARQGAVMAFETMSATLRRTFEPYVIHIISLLLVAFGDGAPEVREAAQDAARVMMGNMSGYGVKLILPDLLAGLDEKQWRTKKGSIELLGMMAYCAPRQLSQSLPVVIPRLTGVLTDSHAQVKSSANKSLKQFGEVISNPEIKALVPVFLKALVDPAKTPNALSALLKTSFMHYIDLSSLALVVPILERGLRERGAETKRKASQIVGNLASLTESKDFAPYLPRLLPLVHVVLVDPVPEARATAAKALGTLVERLGEVHFPELVPGLLRTLKTDTSGVDRQGAAQGLSEVLAGLGMERLEGLLPDIIVNAQSPRSTVKEGFMTLLVFLPATFGTRFQPHLPKIIAPILGGLADSEDFVRDAAMRAGRMIVTNYANKAIDLLLPELETGMFDSGWRIRQSSITLVGELLFKITGISGKNEIEEDEAADVVLAETSKRALVEVLGKERRDRILSALFIARQDSVNVVRQSSLHIWKALVHNTPRTIREIISDLIDQLIKLVSSDEFEQQETASRTATELCKKSGEKLLADIIVALKDRSTSQDARTRTGACLFLAELMQSTTDTQREIQENAIITIVRTSLVDDEAIVRTAAAKAFDILQEQLGSKAIDQTIPTLLEALRQPGESSGTALQALKEVMNVRAHTVFPILIPTLISSPMTLFNARALGSLVAVAGNALSRRLTVIVGALVQELETTKDEELRSAVEETLEILLGSIVDAEGLNTLMLLLLEWAKHHDPKRRASTCKVFATFCETSELDSSLYRVDWIRQLVTLMDDPQVEVHTAAFQALDTFIESVPKEEVESLVVPLRRTIESTGAPGVYVPGFSLPKGVSPMVPIIIGGLTSGSNDQREQAAYAIGDLVERTKENAMRPFVVSFTGPLIRVATQATTHPPAVKTAILTALSTMLERIPVFVKPFFPQLQRTFVKSVGDPASLAVRSKAAQALGVLMKSQPRVDPVVTELIGGARNSGDPISGSFVLALANVVQNGGSNVGAKAKEFCVELISDAFKEHHEEPYCQSIGTLFVALSTTPQLLKPVAQSHLVEGTPATILGSNITSAVLSADDPAQSGLFQEMGLLRGIAKKVLENIGSDKHSISRLSRESKDLLKMLHEDELQGVF